MAETKHKIQQLPADRKKKALRTIGFAALNIAIIAYIALREFGSGESDALQFSQLTVRPWFLIAGFGCFLTALLTEAVKYGVMLRASDGADDPRGAFECAALGKYYDNITPLGSGGQPFQIYYLKKRGYSTGTSGSLPIVGFLGLQFAFVLIALLVFALGGEAGKPAAAIRVTAYIGAACYAFIPACILLFSAAPKKLTRFVGWIIRLLGRLHIIRHPEAAGERVFHSLNSYCESLRLLSGKPKTLAETFFLSLVYQVAILSIPFFVLHAFGGTDSFRSVFELIVYIYAAITIIPTPGNSGAAEGSFYLVFASLSGGYLFWAMLVWRLLCYYSWLALGLPIAGMRMGRRRTPPEKRPLPDGDLSAAQFVDVFYPTVDGAVRTVYAYALRINRRARSCVICPRAASPYEDRFEFDVLRAPALKVPGLSYLVPFPGFSRRLKKYLRENTFDVYHAHSPFAVGRFAVRMGRKLGVPVVATFHSKYYDDIMNVSHCKPLAKMLTRWIVRFYESADAVWTCSRGTAETLRSYGFRGEITVVDNGIDPLPPLDAAAIRARIRSSLTLPDDRRVLLFVGQQIWQKNLRLVLDTAALLRSRGGGYTTLIAGSGYNQEAIHKYALSKGVDDCVRFLGRITDRELLCGMYLASDLFFFPSIYDNAPLVVREAASLGLPALLVRGSNAAEPVEDGVNGFLEDNDSQKMAAKISQIFAQADLKAVGANARNTIPVVWDDIVNEVQDNYRKVLTRCLDADPLPGTPEAESRPDLTPVP